MSDVEKQVSSERSREEGWQQPSWEGEEDDSKSQRRASGRDSARDVDTDRDAEAPRPRADDDSAAGSYERRDSENPPRRGSQGSNDDDDGPMSLLVRHLKFSSSTTRVRKYFEQCGDVKDVYLPVEYESGRPRGFGFVEFYHGRDAQEAFRVLNDSELDGARISITIAQHGRKSPDTMRQRTGGGSSGGRRRFRDGPYDRHERSDRRSSPSRSYRGRYDDSRRERRDDYRRDDYSRDRSGGRDDYRSGGRDEYRSGGRDDYRSGGRDDRRREGYGDHE